MKTLRHDYLDKIALAQAEVNYATGARALVNEEIALTRMSIYHRPSAHIDWAAEHMGAVRRILRAEEREDDDWGDNAGRPMLPEIDVIPEPEPRPAGDLTYTRRIK